MRSSSLVLLSGGLDSYASLHWASQNTDLVSGMTIDYGQKALEKEVQAARSICDIYDIKHRVLQLPFFAHFKSSSLINTEHVLPEIAEKDLDNEVITEKSAQSVWVPNRNGIFINVAAGYAESELIDLVVVGFNVEEAQTFPDNSKSFLDAINKSLVDSTKNKVQVVAPHIGLNKSMIIAWMMKEQRDLSVLWSCYQGEEKMCGVCESCQRLKRALKNGGGERYIPKLF